jgi:O-Antigen ligase
LTYSTTFEPPATSRFSLAGLRLVLVSLVFMSSFLSKFQPAPCDYFFLLALAACLTGGLRFSVALVPLFFLLLSYNLSMLISYAMIADDALNGKQFMYGLAYTSFSGLFIAAYINEDPVHRYHQIIMAYWVGATIGAVLGLISYFKIQPLYAIFPDFGGRAMGGYRDPNVFSTWLVLPLITMLQAFVLGTLRIRPLSVLSFVLIFMALFLSFSRGAWINALMAAVLTITLTFLLSPSRGLRVRIALSGLTGVILLGCVLAVLLSIPATRDLFLDRFTLVKDYDSAETGRFGNQLNSIPLLLLRPLGFGPYQFQVIYGLAPHNTFLNSFAAGGWMGGISFIVFVVSTITVGARTIFMRTPFQPYAIAVFCCYIAVTLQGVQIDTEHWRHLYWMVGLTWGFFAASLYYVRNPLGVDDVLQSWNIKVPTAARQP